MAEKLEEKKVSEGRPFHETILPLILLSNDILIVCNLISETKIPKAHDAIIDALQKRSLIDVYFKDLINATIEKVREKKKLAEQENIFATKKEGVLMIVIEKIIARYQNHAGDLDQEIFKLFEKAKKIKSAANDMDLKDAISDL